MVGKPLECKPLQTFKHRWEDNTEIDLRETGCKRVDWMQLAQDTVQWQAFGNMVMNHQVPYKLRISQQV